VKQFDVCHAIGAARRVGRLIVVLQHPHVDQINTIVVAPLFRPKDLPLISHIRIAVHIDRKIHIAAVDRLAALSAKDLGPTVANLEKHREKFSRAWDLLFFGF
jgi:CcdB protein